MMRLNSGIQGQSRIDSDDSHPKAGVGAASPTRAATAPALSEDFPRDRRTSPIAAWIRALSKLIGEQHGVVFPHVANEARELFRADQRQGARQAGESMLSHKPPPAVVVVAQIA